MCTPRCSTPRCTVLLLLTKDQVEPGSLVLPFSLGGVSLTQRGAASLRVRLARTDGNASAAVYDELGEPVLTVRSLTFRPVQVGQLAGAQRRDRGSLYRSAWVEVPIDTGAAEQPRLAVLGDTAAPGLEGDRHGDLAALAQAIEAGAQAPTTCSCPSPRPRWTAPRVA